MTECNDAAFAQRIGLTGVRVDDPDRITEALGEAFASRGPVVLDAVCNPNVPPLPPHIAWEQAAAIVPQVGRECVVSVSH